MNPTTNKRLETLIYAGLWFAAIVLFVLDIMRSRSYTNMPLFDLKTAGNFLATLLPMFGLFLINNYLLIPRLLKPGHYGRYFMSLLCVIALTWLWQKTQFLSFNEFDQLPKHHRPPLHRPHPMIPLPLFLDVISDLLIVGINLAVSLLFQHFADRFKQESLMKENAENQLTYLKAQINPHFYMNMLNNIHGMIEIDPEKAQNMVIEMSSLMRYMLYDSTHPQIELAAEIGFINDYLALMRVRYPEDSVKTCVTLPDIKAVTGIKVAPLLFVVFLENAFKHGISYSSDSFVSVSLAIAGNRIIFSCMNSIHTPTNAGRHEGIGLENVKRRLDIIYGQNYNLDIARSANTYTVTLTLPPYETENTDN